MKNLLMITCLFFSTNSFAAKVSFTYFGNEGGANTFYACSYAESQAEYYLKTFGAENIQIYCGGGITSWSVMPISLRAEFDLPVLMGTTESVEITGEPSSPACGINTMMIKKFLEVMNNVQVLHKNDSCAFSHSNYSYKLKINL
jgi:hypothetical protein